MTSITLVSKECVTSITLVCLLECDIVILAIMFTKIAFCLAILFVMYFVGSCPLLDKPVRGYSEAGGVGDPGHWL